MVKKTTLELHKKYGWKEQLPLDGNDIRTEVNLNGGVKEEDIDNAIKKYKKAIVSNLNQHDILKGHEQQTSTTFEKRT